MIGINSVTSALLFAGALYAGILSVYTFQKMRTHSEGIPLFLLMGASFFYSAGYGCELFSGDPSWTFAWLRVQYIGLSFMPYLIFTLAMSFTGIYPFKGKISFIFLGVALITFISIQTNPYHHLFYTFIATDTSGPFPTSHLGKGPLYALHMSMFIASCLVSFFLYLKSVITSRGMDKTRQIVLTSTTVFPLASILLYLLEIVPWHIDPSPLSALLCCNLMVFGIHKTGLLELGPLARTLVFSSMSEGVIVTSKPELIADYNNAILKLFPSLSTDMRGKNLSRAIPGLTDTLPSENDYVDFCHTNTCYEIKNLPVVNTKGKAIGNAYIFRDVTREREYIESLKKRALIDGVTELYNRLHWEELAVQAIEQSAKNNNECAIMMVDLDHFKDVNDSYGHEFGDKILRSVSKRMLSVLRDNDLLGRYGGDEFCLCLPNTGKADCIAFCERLHKDVATLSVSSGSTSRPVSISIGITIIQPGQETTLTKSLSQADQALYRAKRNGRNRTECIEV